MSYRHECEVCRTDWQNYEAEFPASQRFEIWRRGRLVAVTHNPDAHAAAKRLQALRTQETP